MSLSYFCWPFCAYVSQLQSVQIDRYQQLVPQERLEKMLADPAAFSREGPLSAFVVLWLMIYQRLPLEWPNR